MTGLNRYRKKAAVLLLLVHWSMITVVQTKPDRWTQT